MWEGSIVYIPVVPGSTRDPASFPLRLKGSGTPDQVRGDEGNARDVSIRIDRPTSTVAPAQAGAHVSVVCRII